MLPPNGLFFPSIEFPRYAGDDIARLSDEWWDSNGLFLVTFIWWNKVGNVYTVVLIHAC